MQHIAFTLNEKEYTIPVLKVREVIKAPALTKLPFVPQYVEGVTNLKGKILAVVNLKKLVGLDGGATGDKIVVVGTEHIKFGFFVDSITGIINLNETDIYAGLETKQLRGSVNINGRVVTPIDAEGLIPAEDLSAANGNGGKLFFDPDAPMNN